MSTRRVLFLCTGNSARSQMAEGWVRSLLSESWKAYSAGTNPAGAVHSLAIEAMSEVDIDISDHSSKHADAVHQISFDLVVTVCDHAAANCPLWLGSGKVVHMPFSDPAAAKGTREERLEAFRKARDSIRDSVIPYLEDFK